MADWKLKLISKGLIIFTLLIAISTTCRLRSTNCPDDGVTKNNENPPKTEPNKGLHGDVSPTGQTEAVKRRKCCPYDFDSSLCQTVNDRVLCGFNRNRGKFDNNQEYRELSDGCRLRGGRVECGYVQAPYTNPRRPPAHNTQEPEQDFYNDGDTINDINTDMIKLTRTVPHSQSTPHKLSESAEQDQFKFSKTTIKSKKSHTRCVEINDRIVCRDF